MQKSMVLSQQLTGAHEVSINCNSLSRGTYIVQLVAGQESATAKFVVIK